MTSDEENAVKMAEANADGPRRKPLRQVKGKERVYSPEHQAMLDDWREKEAKQNEKRHPVFKPYPAEWMGRKLMHQEIGKGTLYWLCRWAELHGFDPDLGYGEWALGCGLDPDTEIAKAKKWRAERLEIEEAWRRSRGL
jgi:hypothetical protein